MAYDSTDAPADVHARERLMRLRDFLAELPPEKFDMGDYIVPGDDDESDIDIYSVPIKQAVDVCGTAACIAGWAQVLFNPTESQDEELARVALGLTEEEGQALFCPWTTEGSSVDRSEDLTLTQAVRVIDHLLATGDVDWSVRGEP